jgi:energy-coupling factor transporter ATP-binding protein EcfA2
VSRSSAPDRAAHPSRLVERLAFARLFLHNPDIIVRDEATSALDQKSQAKMMS